MRTVGTSETEKIFGRAWDKFLFTQYGEQSICIQDCMWALQQSFLPERLAEQKKSENLLEAYRGMDFQNIVEDAKPLEKMETKQTLCSGC